MAIETGRAEPTALPAARIANEFAPTSERGSDETGLERFREGGAVELLADEDEGVNHSLWDQKSLRFPKHLGTAA